MTSLLSSLPSPFSSLQARRQSKRLSFRSIPCEWEDGGVQVVEALAELGTSERGWVLVGYRADCATLYLQAKSPEGASVADLVPLLKDDEQQYVQFRFMDTVSNEWSNQGLKPLFV